MNKKLKLYTTLLVIVILGSLFFGNAHVNSSTSYQTTQPDSAYGLSIEPLPAEFATIDSIEGGVRTNYKPTLELEVYVRPQFMAGDKVLMSRANGHTCRVDMQKVKLHVPADQSTFQSSSFIVLCISFVILIPIIIWLLVIVFRIIKSIRRGEVFVSKTASHLETLGKLLIAFELYSYLMAYLILYLARQHFSLAGYDIVAGDEFDLSYIILGLVLMIISQILLMGKELKEEQELTI